MTSSLPQLSYWQLSPDCCVTFSQRSPALRAVLLCRVWLKLWLGMQQLTMVGTTETGAAALQCVCATSWLLNAASVRACAFGANPSL